MFSQIVAAYNDVLRDTQIVHKGVGVHAGVQHVQNPARLGVHAAVGRVVLVIVASGVQQPVQGVEEEFPARAVRGGVPAARGLVHADGDVDVHRMPGLVLREGQYIGGGIKAHVARMERRHALVVDELHGSARHRETEQRDDARHGSRNPFTIRSRQVRERRAGEFHRRGRFRASRRSTVAVGVHPVQRPAVADT